MGGRSSSSSASSTTNLSSATDNRMVLGEGSIGAGSGGTVSLSDMRDMSTNLSVTDYSNRSSSTSVTDSGNTSSSWSWSDGSNRSINDSGNTSITSIDPGALKAMETAILSNEASTREALRVAQQAASSSASAANASQSSAFNFAANANATVGAGFSKLLDAGLQMFSSNVAAVGKTADLTAQAYQAATAEKSGSLDNKTIVMLGLGALAVFGLMAWKK